MRSLLAKIVEARRPTGVAVGVALALTLAGLAWVASLGSPSDVPVVVWVLMWPAYTRATQIIANDELLEPARTRFAVWAGYKTGTDYELTKLAYLAGCPWCLSVYVAAALSAVVLAAPGSVAAFVVLLLAGSELAVIGDRLVDRFAPDPPTGTVAPPEHVPPVDVEALFTSSNRDEVR